ncbi:hypothetical protein PSAC2689_20249 [Paraburkholderia sacchari]
MPGQRAWRALDDLTYPFNAHSCHRLRSGSAHTIYRSRANPIGSDHASGAAINKQKTSAKR